MRTIYCGHLNSSHIGQEVTLCGWVNRRRDFGGLIFIDMRDREGIVQIIFDPKQQNVFSLGTELRNEFCLKLTGIVRPRPCDQINHNMTTGSIEVIANQLNIINKSEPLPLDDKQNNTEEQRLKYRYLDLRRPVMIQRFKERSRISNFIHRFMEIEGFLNIETPMLTKAMPEGARDYLVPSRVHKGKFYALPQSPQLFKQMLMISGFDRYYQIAKCFRDEDLRSDRQPEFTQIDIEMSFMTTLQVQKIIEQLICSLWHEIINVDLEAFPQITYADSMRRFGSDKPDLRNPMELIDIGDLVKDVKFKIFSIPANDINGRVAALRVPSGSRLSHIQIDEYNKYVQTYGAKGLIWMKFNQCITGKEEIQSSITKFLSKQLIKKILMRTQAINGDIIFFCADNANIVNFSLGALRIKLGADLRLTNTNCWKALWITDFPMFKKNQNNNLVATHHPFTAPKDIDINTLISYPLNVISTAYDLVINGYEIGSGSMRIHCANIQKIIFDILGIDKNKQEKEFGFLLDAFKYGTPIHAGIALGLDRIVMLLTNTNNIRDVIAFPKTTAATDLLMEAPSDCDNNILKDMSIDIINKNKTNNIKN